MKTGRLLSLNTALGRPQAVDGRMATALARHPVDGVRRVSTLGIEGDEPADPSAHASVGRAVHAYPSEHYPFWQTVRTQAQVAAWDEPLAFGSLGEHLTLQGVTEIDLWVGDVLSFPGCELAVSEPRLPSAELDAALGFAHAARLMMQSGWSGVYLAVRSPGTIAAGQAFTLRPGPREVGIVELFRARAGRAA